MKKEIHDYVRVRPEKNLLPVLVVIKCLRYVQQLGILVKHSQA